MSDNVYEIGKYPPVNQDQFLALRANAIQAYANLEMSLKHLFAGQLGIPTDVAGLVLFRITNTHARTRILNDLHHKNQGAKYDRFWKSLLSLVRTLDQRCNEIVHWHVVQTINLGLDHKDAARLSLAPPAGWAAQSTAISENELTDFIQRCDFAHRLINMFDLVLYHPTIHTEREPWLKIFEQPIIYPPPDTHPLFGKDAAREGNV